MKNKIIILLIIAVISIQFIKPQKNKSTTFNTINNIPEEVHTLLKTACYDCHSNNTLYPWYNNIQPIAWWLSNHVREGKEKLNFEEPISEKDCLEIIEVIEENEMPLFSYTLIHKDAKLSIEQKNVILNWLRKI